jgi:hypothetical protein
MFSPQLGYGRLIQHPVQADVQIWECDSILAGKNMGPKDVVGIGYQ